MNKSYQFGFEQKFDKIQTNDRIFLHGLLFKVVHSRGLIYYLHGNAGSLRSWGEVAKTYTDLNYDVFMLDYRGYRKSEGSINDQEQFLRDVQRVYDALKKKNKDGTQDEVIYYGSSLKLKEQFRPQDTLITLDEQEYNGMTYTKAYTMEVQKILDP